MFCSLNPLEDRFIIFIKRKKPPFSKSCFMLLKNRRCVNTFFGKKRLRKWKNDLYIQKSP
ncbi:MAG: hypothetical protein COT00_04165 [Candidatus Omnitrophica bacterium CG07_land_8_20_14_0_80_50_8]|nr:MAG: hypothetical protein AUJ71_02675 [Candidatus Omnitrophica bacterium CG1_02_49_16]PIU39965.1 MAG: hypothetical protein COT00_04165 [Candidatus Omnitrophica bacterium CG07_land_8_20_14_0_80_50_8]